MSQFVFFRPLAFLGTALLVIVLIQLFVARNTTSQRASFFFEHASPESLSFRNNRLTRADVPLITEQLSVLNRLLIDQYVTWHQSIVAKVQSGELDGSTIKTLVYVGNNAGHGLGDRLRGLLLAYLSAVISNRLFLIHWQDPFSLSKVLVNNNRSNFTYDEHLFPSRLGADGKPDVKRVRKATLEDMHFFFGNKGNQTKIMFVCEPPLSLDGLYKAVKKFPDLPISMELSKTMPFKVHMLEGQFFPLILKALFRPSAELRRMMMIETNDDHNYYAPIRFLKGGPLRPIDTSRRFISLHVRLGFGLGEYNERFEHQMEGQTIESVAQCLAKKAMVLAEQEQIVSPPRFYLACDTVALRVKLKRALLSINSHAEVMYGRWDIKHVRDMVERTKKDLRLLMYTFVDLYVLSKGQAILRSNSGFAKIATWMGAIPNDMYYDIYTDCEHI